jgi:hypothetical protein
MANQYRYRDDNDRFWGPPWERDTSEKESLERVIRKIVKQEMATKPAAKDTFKPTCEDTLPPEPTEGRPPGGPWKWTGRGWQNLAPDMGTEKTGG